MIYQGSIIARNKKKPDIVCIVLIALRSLSKIRVIIITGHTRARPRGPLVINARPRDIKKR